MIRRVPTISLYQRNIQAPDAWRQVSSPGGYEWWYFYAEDVENDRQIVAILLEGFVFHPGYLRQYARYRRRPTRVPPPLPAQFPCAYFVVYEEGRIVKQFMTQYRTGALEARCDSPAVTVGPNSFKTNGSSLKLALSGTPWKLTFHGPVLLENEKLEAEFMFEPRLHHPPQERVFLSRALAGADHHWVIANPLCDVSGTIRMNGRSIDFRGRGYHDHNYGTAPLGAGLKRWIWGRVLFDDLACTFHFAQARNPSLADEIHLIQADATGVREIAVAVVEGSWSGLTANLLRYPRELRFENALWLANARVIDSAPFYLRLMYEAQHDDRRGRAFCEIAYPHRLRWPVLGRMIEMSIDKRLV
jgi:carotenoid 1,2-hydratase